MRPLFLCALGLTLLAADNTKQLPEGPGRAVTQRICGSCHGFGNFVRRRESRDGWNNVIEDMIRRGAKGEEEEFAEISDYLVAQFSPVRVNVNQATAQAIAEGLNIKPAHAEAIVAAELGLARARNLLLDRLLRPSYLSSLPQFAFQFFPNSLSFVVGNRPL